MLDGMRRFVEDAVDVEVVATNPQDIKPYTVTYTLTPKPEPSTRNGTKGCRAALPADRDGPPPAHPLGPDGAPSAAQPAQGRSARPRGRPAPAPAACPRKRHRHQGDPPTFFFITLKPRVK